MAVTSQSNCVIQKGFQICSKHYILKHVQGVASIAHSSVVMGDVVRLPSFVLVEMDAETTAMNNGAPYAVSTSSK